ncbi:MAG TPA: hypothetical protein PLT51_00595 [Candidatus Dojkabacteria bacterium]|nr:hypothetical protein [Candidatus Dojkabacteria bacterium]
MIEIDESKITRIEVINHADNGMPAGRILVLYKDINDFHTMDISMQDDGRTMKIFLNAKPKENL